MEHFRTVALGTAIAVILSSMATARELSAEAGLTTTFQDSNDSNVGSEWLASADLLITRPTGPGEFTLYIEGSSSPQPGEVSTAFPEVNADAGSALDRDGDGRLQVSEFRYALPLATGATLHAGLMDATVFFDASGPSEREQVFEFSGTANDETTQFLATPFVNNPTIEFPDYSLGAVFEQPLPEGLPLLKIGLFASDGLADNPDASYSELFDITDDGKGVFAIAEAYQNLGGTLATRAGLWTHSADHAPLDGRGSDQSNYGAYAVLDGPLAGGAWNLRIGLANEAVSPAAEFVGLAAEHPLGKAMAGAALGWTGASKELPAGSDDSRHAELYVRFHPTDWLSVSPDIQYVENSGFDRSQDGLIYGLRLTAAFTAL